MIEEILFTVNPDVLPYIIKSGNTYLLFKFRLMHVLVKPNSTGSYNVYSGETELKDSRLRCTLQATVDYIHGSYVRGIIK